MNDIDGLRRPWPNIPIVKAWACVSALVVSQACAGNPSPQLATPDNDAAKLPADWIFLPNYSDEFSGTEIDAAKWQLNVPPWGKWSWSDRQVSVSNGYLRIEMRNQEHHRSGQVLNYVGGIARSRDKGLLYGYIEARIKAAPRFPGVVSAFWIFRNSRDYWTEIDIAELMQRRQDRNVVDYSLYVLRDGTGTKLPVRYKADTNVRWDPSADFHVYALMWTPERIIHLVDGVPISSQVNRYWHREMDVVLSIGLRAPLDDWPSATGFPTAMIVDYVHCWGPPESARQPEMKPPGHQP